MSEHRPLVTILIVNWNGSALLEECLNSLSGLAYSPVETIVVDNGSTDDSLAVVSRHSSVKILRLDKNYGFAVGNNRGARIAQGKYIATLNNDMVVAPDWLNKPVASLESNPEIGIICCRQMNYFDHDKIDGLGHSLENWLGLLPIGYGERMHQNPQFSHAGYVISANGGSAIYRTALFNDLGGFDERFIAYNEEGDLCVRALLRGWKCLYVPEAVVYHRGAASYMQNLSTYYYYRERNRWWFLYKTFPLSWILLHLPSILLYELRVAWVVAMKCRLPRTYLRSRIDAIMGFSLFCNERRIALTSFQEHSDFIKYIMKNKISFANRETI